MRIFLILFSFVFASIALLAQPTTITYQGKLLDNVGHPVNLNGVAMTFAIYNAPSGGTKLWPSGVSASKSVDVVNGLYSVTLGTGSGSDDVFASSVFDGVTPYLEVGVNSTTLPRTLVTSVPTSILSNSLSSAAWASPSAIGSTAPSSGAFTALTVGTGTSTYTFPSLRGTNGQILQTDGSGTLSWTTSNFGLTNFTESNYTHNTKTGVKLLATNAETDVDFVLSSKGQGGILAQQPDGASTGGNNRGIFAVDLQSKRASSTQVASGSYSNILGGLSNTASAIYSNVAGGHSNTASGYYSNVGGGFYNTASGYSSNVAGGFNNIANKLYSHVSGGYTNMAFGDFSTVAGGSFNIASGESSNIAGGNENNASAIFSTVAGGSTNTASGGNSNVAGGFTNTASGESSNIAGGNANTASGSWSNVAGGQNNTASAIFSSVAGGYTNTASGESSFVSGNFNTAQSFGETVLGIYATIGSGNSTTRVSTDRLFVIGNGTGSASKSNALTMLKDGSFTSSTGASLTFTGVWTNASDSRLKTNIHTTNYGLAEVMKLNPVNYNMINGNDAQVGFIAQEVRGIIPEVVSGFEGDLAKGETLGISYGNLVPVLTKAIQEQQHQIKSQGELIKQLQDELASIKNELASAQNLNGVMLDKFVKLTAKLSELLDGKNNAIKTVSK